MREDGFEFDKWLMTTDRNFQRPSGPGPDSMVKAGKAPEAFPLVAAAASTPAVATAKRPKASTDAAARLLMPATLFAGGKVTNYYVDQGKWLAINPDKAKSASAERTFPYPTGRYDVVLLAVGENDGRSTYSVAIDGKTIGHHQSPLAAQTYEEGPKFNRQWKGILVTEGAIVGVKSTIASEDGKEFSRARVRAVAFIPADEATLAAAKSSLDKQAPPTAPMASDTSPTTPVSQLPLQQPRQADGDGSVVVSGEHRVWHKVTVDLAGPYAHEKDNAPNPFTDYRMTVQFRHTDGTQYTMPGYFAADGDAGNSSAEDGTVWRAHFAPDRAGKWAYTIRFHRGKLAALGGLTSQSMDAFHDKQGTIEIDETDKQGRDLRSEGRLRYVGKHYLRFAGSGRYFLKVGADAPETLLAFKDFDNTIAGNPKKAPVKSWQPHVQDWRPGDPTWKGGKGKGLIGAVNYLSGKGCNAFSFLTYNAGGDGDNVWPFIHRDDKLHYDCSKLDQWSIVFDHGTARGMYLHFKMQETEIDDHTRGHNGNQGRVVESLDGGHLGTQRKLYCRELIARFGHNLALNWNLGEENTQTTEQVKAMIDYIASLDTYDHNIVIHTFPGQQDQVYGPLLGDGSKLTGASLQNSSLQTTHAQTVKWVQASAAAGKPWIVAFDESGSAKHAQCPDLGYNGFDGHDRNGQMAHTQHEVRKQTLWGTLMAGGAGNEYYFGYQFDQNDIVCEDWRSRDQSWDYCRIAIHFFRDHKIPFWEMKNADALVGNPDHGVSRFCFAKANQVYLVYLPEGGEAALDLTHASGEFSVHWFNPRAGGELRTGAIKRVTAGAPVKFSAPDSKPGEDWLAVIRKN